MNRSSAVCSAPVSALLPEALYTAAQVRALDRHAIDACGIPGAVLMQRAGRATFAAILNRWPNVPLHVVCGTGNNGGDGSVIAALAQARGLPVTLWQVGSPQKIGGDALRAREVALAAPVPVRPFDAAAFAAAADGVIVDALLGTGPTGPGAEPVREPFAAAIRAINEMGARELPVVAVDIPSGLCADSGQPLGCAVKADLTVTFIGLKRGLLTAGGPDHCGELLFADLQVPATVYEAELPAARLLPAGLPGLLLPRRARDAHKGHFGHVLIVGGNHGMAGAAMLACEGAGRTGAGLVSCATRPDHALTVTLRRPEVMTVGVHAGRELEGVLPRATVIGIGPGLGRDGWASQLLQQALAAGRPLVVDADALNLLAELPATPRRHDWILTPHPGEAARLLGTATAAIQADRFAAAGALQQRYGGVVILKGRGTVIAGPDGISVSPFGNAGMASGGMGDVLTGIAAGLRAQAEALRLTLQQVAELAVVLHGQAGDRAAEQGERGLLASDLLAELRGLGNPL